MLCAAVAAVSAELRATLLNKTCKTLQFLCHFVNSVYNSKFCTHWPILCKILHAQNCRILTSVNKNNNQINIAPYTNASEIYK